MIIYWKIFFANTNDHKKHERVVILDTKKISAIDKVFIDIALKKQELFNDSKLFVPLRYLFVEFKDKNIRYLINGDGFTCVMNLHTIYREDQNGHEISYSQFSSILRGRDIVIDPNYSCIHGYSISEEELARQIAWDQMPLRKEDFNLSTKEIEILKLFCEDAKILRESHFLGRDSLPALSYRDGENRPYHVEYKIDENEAYASYIIFRRLIMQKEKGCFFKAKNIILDKRKNSHAIFDVLLEQGKKINNIWEKQGEEVFFANGILHYIPELKNMRWGKFINAILNHGLFHQKNDNGTREDYDQYALLINSPCAFDALFFIGVHEIARKICNFAGYVEDILNILGEEIIIPESKKRITPKQEEFEKFLIDKIGELAFILHQKENDLATYSAAKKRANDLLHKTFKGKLRMGEAVIG